jgi:ankyrin repeat protein
MQSLGRLDRAESLLLEGLKRGHILGEFDLNNLAATHSLGNLYLLQKKVAEAEETYRAAIKGYEAVGKTNDANFARCLRDCAYVLESRGQFERSVEMANRALVIAEKTGDTRLLAELLSWVARKTRASGLYPQALEAYERIKTLQLKHSGESSPGVIETVLSMARCMRSLNQFDKALETYEDALVRFNNAEHPNRMSQAEALLEMGEISEAKGAFVDVEQLCVRSLKILQKYVGAKESVLLRMANSIKAAREDLWGDAAFIDTNEFLWLFSQGRNKAREIFQQNPDLIKQTDKSGWGPVQWALFVGWEDLMRMLVRNGGQCEGFPSTVMSPIHVAVSFTQGATIQFLQEQNTSLEIIGPGGWRPVHFAAYHNRQNCLEQLVSRGCQADVVDEAGSTPLHLAADQGHNEMVIMLLAMGLKIDAQDTTYGRSPLHYAAMSGHGAVVRTLLLNCANDNLRDNQDKTPIDLAEEQGNKGLAAAMKHFSTMEK